jgi:hypothetical protein
VADAYHWILPLSWRQFVNRLSGAYLALNIVFAFLYEFDGGSKQRTLLQNAQSRGKTLFSTS